jgi:benzodiazapine receptor
VVFGVQRLVPTFKPDWYRALRKPSWTPPNWIFPAVWIPLKLLQSAALWLVWRAAPGPKQLALPLTLFGVHMFLGNWWNVSVTAEAASACGD